jgi:urease accessory protein
MRRNVLSILLLLPTLAYAHAGAGEGFLRGLQHPLGGIDHVLAMLAVGVFLGLRLAGPVRLLVASAAIVGLFAVFHGYAHGMESPAYGAGFLIATALLHGVGIAAALLIRRIQWKVAQS